LSLFFFKAKDSYPIDKRSYNLFIPELKFINFQPTPKRDFVNNQL